MHIPWTDWSNLDEVPSSSVHIKNALKKWDALCRVHCINPWIQVWNNSIAEVQLSPTIPTAVHYTMLYSTQGEFRTLWNSHSFLEKLYRSFLNRWKFGRLSRYRFVELTPDPIHVNEKFLLLKMGNPFMHNISEFGSPLCLQHILICTSLFILPVLQG